MNEKKKICDSECQCEGPGFCPVYGIKVTAKMHAKCKNDEVWRYNYQNFFSPPKNEDERHDRQIKALKHQEKANRVAQLDEVIDKIEEEGVTLENYDQQQEGLGDLLGSVFSKMGITEEAIEKWTGVGGCGCGKRKQFLNKILPFRKSEPSIAPKKEEP